VFGQQILSMCDLIGLQGGFGGVAEVVPEFVEVEVAVLRPEPVCGRLGLSAKTNRRTADDRQADDDE